MAKYKRFKGYLLAALAAAFYGTNPIFAVPLYDCGMNPASVLFFRYLLGIPILAAILAIRSERLLPKPGQTIPVATLGIVMGLSSLALYESYNYMNAGIASTLLFMYPLLTSLAMIIFFHEKFRPGTAASLTIMGSGLYLMMNPEHGANVSFKGLVLIFISSLTYTIYLVMVKVSKTLQQIPVIQSLLYQLLSGSLVFIAVLLAGEKFIIPLRLTEWLNLVGLALLPTVLSLFFTIGAINSIGPTPTAIFGALEPITAVALSILLLGETITTRETIGGVLILCATMLVMITGQNKRQHAIKNSNRPK